MIRGGVTLRTEKHGQMRRLLAASTNRFLQLSQASTCIVELYIDHESFESAPRPLLQFQVSNPYSQYPKYILRGREVVICGSMRFTSTQVQCTMAPSYTPILPLTISRDPIFTYFTTLLRTLRLSIIRQISPSCLKSEQPKVAIFRDRRVAALHVFLHIIPLGAAISLILLNTVTLHVGNVSSLSLTALQFAAKSLEILMQASLTAILLALIRNRIVTNRDGVAFGGLLAPYRMTEISYLWSLEFWGAATSFTSSTAFKIAFCALVPMFVILGALVGPSSAILMIPRIGNYPRASLIAYMGPKDMIHANHLDLVNASNADGTNSTMVLR